MPEAAATDTAMLHLNLILSEPIGMEIAHAVQEELHEPWSRNIEAKQCCSLAHLT